LAAWVLVPETPIHKHNRLPFRENKVRLAGKAATVQSETQTEPMSSLAHQDFGRRILPVYGAHNRRAPGFGYMIDHYFSIRCRNNGNTSSRICIAAVLLIGWKAL